MYRVYKTAKPFTFLGEETSDLEILTNMTHAIIKVKGIPVASVRFKRKDSEKLIATNFVNTLLTEQDEHITPFDHEISYVKGKYYLDGLFIGFNVKELKMVAGTNLATMLSASRTRLKASNNPNLREYLNELYGYYFYEGVHYYDHPVCTNCEAKKFSSIQY